MALPLPELVPRPPFLPPDIWAELDHLPAHVLPLPARPARRPTFSRRPTCPKCGSRMRLHLVLRYLGCANCALRLWLTPAQTWEIEAILRRKAPPSVSLPARLAEIALLQLGVTPVGYPK